MSIDGTALGHHYRIRCADTDLERFLSESLRHLAPSDDWTLSEATLVDLRWRNAQVAVEVSGREVYRGEPTAALARVMNAVNVRAVRAAGGDPVLHCGVVSIGATALLLPGRPGAGKSTMTTALLLAGLGYLSDEAAPIGPDLRVRPYPKPLVVGSGSWTAVSAAESAAVELRARQIDAWWIDPARLGCPVAQDPLPVGAVVAPQYRAGATLEIERMSPAEATAVMASNTFNMHEHGIEGVRRTASLTAGVPLLRVTFGDAGSACSAIISEIGA